MRKRLLGPAHTAPPRRLDGCHAALAGDGRRKVTSTPSFGSAAFAHFAASLYTRPGTHRRARRLPMRCQDFLILLPHCRDIGADYYFSRRDGAREPYIGLAQMPEAMALLGFLLRRLIYIACFHELRFRARHAPLS